MNFSFKLLAAENQPWDTLGSCARGAFAAAWALSGYRHAVGLQQLDWTLP